MHRDQDELKSVYSNVNSLISMNARPLPEPVPVPVRTCTVVGTDLVRIPLRIPVLVDVVHNPLYLHKTMDGTG